MPADKLGEYMTSDTFLERANASIEKAVRRLEEKGITPAFITLDKPDTTGSDAGAQDQGAGSSEADNASTP
jgi:hypothetical protein